MKCSRFSAVKRGLDICLAIPALMVLSPLIFLIGVLIRLTMGSPVLFKQERPGLKGAPFHMYKFRTMSSSRDNEGHLLPDAERLTPLGRFLRGASLDELPELFNVLKGDMSIVGPRPVTAEEVELYGQHAEAYLAVRPGLTGAWQVSGRSDTTFAERVKLDVDYVRNQSFLRDLQIVSQTVKVVASRQGAC